MIIIEAILSPTFFSIRSPESFQVAETLLLPPPSTIAGAFAFSYALWKNENFIESLKKLAKNAWYFSVPLSPIVLSSVILSRSRLMQVEKRKIKKKDIMKIVSRSDYRKLESQGLLDKIRYRYQLLDALWKIKSPTYWKYYLNTFFDAMVRRYVFTTSLYIAGLVNVDERFTLCFSRMGDTESMINVREIAFIEDYDLETLKQGEECRTESYAFTTYGNTKVVTASGDYTLQQMTGPMFLLERIEKRRKISHIGSCALPLKRVIKRIGSKEISAYEPSSFSVEVLTESKLLSYRSKLLNSNINVIIPKGGM